MNQRPIACSSQPASGTVRGIVVRGDRLEHWLNGRMIVAATVGDDEWRRRMGESKFTDEEKFGENRSGRIMLTDHGSDVAYRKFVFRPVTIAP